MVEEVIEQFRTGQLGFPYKREFLTVDVENVKQILRETRAPTNYSGQIIGGRPVIEIPPDPTSYDLVDYVTDLFTEDIRLQASAAGRTAPIDEWNKRMEEVIRRAAMTGPLPRDLVDLKHLIRETFYQMGIREATQFKVSLAAMIYNSHAPAMGKVLDPCAGWGDRLLAAMSLGLDYTGCDPNTALEEGHAEIEEVFGDEAHAHMFYHPFEDVYLGNQLFDLVFTSPPYHDFEDYSADPGQSARRYRDYDQWIQQWYKPAIAKMIRLLRPGCTLALHVGSFRGRGKTRFFDKDTLEILLQSPRLRLKFTYHCLPKPIYIYVCEKI